ncbi:MAG: undecaprenyl/decaprenyl-phosphate alpha-N-acetylglucosaminyl 1-phosphate transferase [Labilibaculum sp.]|nr:undecaprenyl/decaprenyl-phosphate alpha-N-acetylglucosaminyl 1-phosphate transferase [Labilibaculum sp.]
MNFLLENHAVYGMLIVLASLVISYVVIPRVIKLVEFKQLMDDPDHRSSHTEKTPTLGGISFYVSLMLCVFFIKWADSTTVGYNLTAGLTVLFIVGLKDDLMVLSAKTKIVAQLLALSFLLVNTDVHMTFFGFFEPPLWLAIGISWFIGVAIVNAYNLIDGIDGLASLVGIVIFSIFGFLFFQMDETYYFLLSMIPVGFLMAFLRYNLSNKRKIFMGDTGSMIVGFMMTVLSLRLLSVDESQLAIVNIKQLHLLPILLAVLFIPFIDTTRVTIIRLLNKKSPFAPDRNHVHHILIDNGLSHLNSSLLLSAVSLIVFIIIYVANMYVGGLVLLAISVALVFIADVLLFYFNPNESAHIQKENLKKHLPKTAEMLQRKNAPAVKEMKKELF